MRIKIQTCDVIVTSHMELIKCCYTGNGSIRCYINFGLAWFITPGITDPRTLLDLLPPYYIPRILGISPVVGKSLKKRFKCFDLRWLLALHSTLKLESRKTSFIFVAICLGCNTKLTGLLRKQLLYTITAFRVRYCVFETATRQVGDSFELLEMGTYCFSYTLSFFLYKVCFLLVHSETTKLLF